MIQKPRRWNIGLIRNFMLAIGPVSSLFDFLTFYVLLKLFHASERLFQTGWFVESLATQTLVVFIIRTARNPFRNLPSKPLSAAVVAIVVIGGLLPFTPLAGPLGFVPLPPVYFIFLVLATGIYLFAVEITKRRLLRASAPEGIAVPDGATNIPSGRSEKGCQETKELRNRS